MRLVVDRFFVDRFVVDRFVVARFVVARFVVARFVVARFVVACFFLAGFADGPVEPQAADARFVVVRAAARRLGGPAGMVSLGTDRTVVAGAASSVYVGRMPCA